MFDNTNKHFIIRAVLFALFLFLISPHVLLASKAGDIAKEMLNKTAQASNLITSPSQASNIYEIAGYIINIILGFVGVIFLILVIAGGYLWMTAGGNEDKVTKGKNLLIQSIIALIIVLSAFLLTNFVVIRLMASLWG